MTILPLPASGEYQYLSHLRYLIECGVHREGRNGGTRGMFGAQMRFRLADGFPLLTTKKLFTKAIIHELLWFISGSTNVKYLQDNGVSIWDEWADANGELGPVYGKQWRSWPQAPKIDTRTVDREGWGQFDERYVTEEFEPIDQFANVIASIRNDPYSRRHIVSAWNPAEVDDMALPPCHCLFQFHVRPALFDERMAYVRHTEGEKNLDNVLSVQLYQRSADIFLGVPFNIASYALLLQMVAQVTNTIPGDFVHTFGDLHLYDTHLEQAHTQLEREPRKFPTMRLNTARTEIDEFTYADFTLVDYVPHPAIAAPVSV